MHSLSALLFLATFCLSGISALSRHPLRSYAFASSSELQQRELLEVIQVYPPPLSPNQLVGSTACSYTLMNHVFGHSADRPFIGTYEPLCGHRDWDVVTLNLSVVSYGRQFDRLGSVWIGNTEVWRTCTAEPTWWGIHFSFAKDISAFKALLRNPQSLVVDIGNYIVGPYNGSFNATLTIEFRDIVSPTKTPPADEIISLYKTSEHGNYSTYYSLPNDNTNTSILLPANASRAILEVYASGNGQEEFWYSNVPDEYIHTFKDYGMQFLGGGSFREIIVYVNGHVAGAAWPFEVVFTGGICPGYWRPLVGHRTFDLPTYTFDLTPLIPLLQKNVSNIAIGVQGQPHTLQNWYVSGQLHIWYGNETHFDIHPPIPSTADISWTGNVSHLNESFSVSTHACRRDQMYEMEYQNSQSYGLISNDSAFRQKTWQKTKFGTPLTYGHYEFENLSEEVSDEAGRIHVNGSLKQIFRRHIWNYFDELPTEEEAEVTTQGTFVFVPGVGVSEYNGTTSVTVSFVSPTRSYRRTVKALNHKIISDVGRDVSIEPGLRGGIRKQIP